MPLVFISAVLVISSALNLCAEDYFASRVFQFQQQVANRPVSFPVTIADTEKRVYISTDETKKSVYFTISQEAITIRAGGQPIIFTGEDKKKILKGGFLPYSEGAVQLFAASEPDIDYILIGYDKMAHISTIVHLKKK